MNNEFASDKKFICIALNFYAIIGLHVIYGNIYTFDKVCLNSLKDIYREKVPSNKTPRFTKLRNMGFGLLVHQINSF